jgi:SAM-dependent methyltransferase
MTDNTQGYFGRDLEAMAGAVGYHRWIAGEFGSFIGKTAVEVGAGCGNFSAILLEYSIDRLMLFEPDSQMFAHLQRRFAAAGRVCCYNDVFAAARPSFGVDSIFYVNVLEHIENDAAELELAYSALKPGGCIFIFVPAMPGLMSDFDRQVGHYRRYRLAGLQKKAEKAGFHVVKSRYFDFPGAFAWFAAMKIMKRTHSGNDVKLYETLVVPVLRRIEPCFSLPFGKNILMIAQKP